MLKVLSIGNNERITSKSMKGMKNFTYNNLVQLDISSTSIDDEGINYLVHNKFPMLASINLANTDITKDGLLLLNTLKAPNLQILDLSCNSLSVDDLA